MTSSPEVLEPPTSPSRPDDDKRTFKSSQMVMVMVLSVECTQERQAVALVTCVQSAGTPSFDDI